jgi:hypothetical protein
VDACVGIKHQVKHVARSCALLHIDEAIEKRGAAYQLQGHSNSGPSRRRGLEQTRLPGPGDIVVRTDSMQRTAFNLLRLSRSKEMTL